MGVFDFHNRILVSSTTRWSCRVLSLIPVVVVCSLCPQSRVRKRRAVYWSSLKFGPMSDGRSIPCGTAVAAGVAVSLDWKRTTREHRQKLETRNATKKKKKKDGKRRNGRTAKTPTHPQHSVHYQHNHKPNQSPPEPPNTYSITVKYNSSRIESPPTTNERTNELPQSSPRWGKV